MKESFFEILERCNQLLRTGSDAMTAARKLSVEFYATAYVNSGELWVSYTDSEGRHQRRVLASA